MNRYGLIARDHWQAHAPARYESLENPEEYFTALGESVLAQVDQTARDLERQLPTDLPYLERVAQLRAVQLQAEELALADLVYSVEPESTDLVEELEMLLDQLPSTSMIRDALATLDLQIQEDADRERRRALPTDEQSTRRRQLEDLLPLVSGPDPQTQDEAQLRWRILALAPYRTTTLSE